MEKQPNEKRGLFDNDELDDAIANVDDTGMVKSQQPLIEDDEIESLPPQEEEEEESP